MLQSTHLLISFLISYAVWAVGVIFRNAFSTPQEIFVTLFCLLSSVFISFYKMWSTELYFSDMPHLYHIQITTIPFFRQAQVMLSLFAAKLRWQFVSNCLHAVHVLFLWSSLSSASYELCSSVCKFLFYKAKFILFESVWPSSLFSATSVAFSFLYFMV